MEGTDNAPENLNIALISFIFDNGELIKSLKNRGKLINNEYWPQLYQLDKYIWS